MVKLVRKDIRAALVLSWLKYSAVTEEDVKMMNVLQRKKPQIVEKSKRKLLRIEKNENPGTPEFRLPKRVKNLAINSSNFSQKKTEIHGAGNRKRVRESSSGSSRVNSELMSKTPETHEAAASGTRNSNPNPKRVRVLPSTLLNLPENSSGSAPRLPPIESLTTLIGECSNPFMKHLTKSDVDEHQGRLLLNNEDVRTRLLPLLNEESEDVAKGINVKTYNPMGEFFEMRFKTWGNHKSYVLLGNWKAFIKKHDLKENDCVTIWMFRHNQTGELCFALTWRKKEEEEEEEEEEED